MNVHNVCIPLIEINLDHCLPLAIVHLPLTIVTLGF
jgi:hypothetical protein